MRVGDMDDKHLANSIARIERLNWRRRWLPRLRLEQELRKQGLRT
jgi:hypothetical protein